MPFLMLQQLVLSHCIRCIGLHGMAIRFSLHTVSIYREQSSSLLKYGLVALTSLAFLLPWQFSQFVLVTQSFSLLILHSLRILPSTRVTGILLSLAAALLTNIVLQFGNSLLLFSLLPSSIASCLVRFTVMKFAVRHNMLCTVAYRQLQKILGVLHSLEDFQNG